MVTIEFYGGPAGIPTLAEFKISHFPEKLSHKNAIKAEFWTDKLADFLAEFKIFFSRIAKKLFTVWPIFFLV